MGLKETFLFAHTQKPQEVDPALNGYASLPELLSPPDTKHFNLFGSIDESKVNNLIEQIESARITEAQKELFLKVKSDGGNVMQAYALITALEAYDVGTISQSAKSAGALLVVAGSAGKRYIVAGTPIMIHDLSHEDGVRGRVQQMHEALTGLMDFRENMIEFYNRKTKLKRKDIKAILESREDTYFSDKEAVKYGLVDHILGQSGDFNLSENMANFNGVQGSRFRFFNSKR